MTTIKKYLTYVVFACTILLSVLSLGLSAILDEPYVWVGIVLIFASILFNLWSVRKSEKGGFVNSREFRRAYEPARRFNMVQVFIVFSFVIVQCCMGAYVLIS